MKKVISANIEISIAEKLYNISKESFPHVSKSAIVEYALENVHVENFIKEAKIENNSEEKARKEKASRKKEIN